MRHFVYIAIARLDTVSGGRKILITSAKAARGSLAMQNSPTDTDRPFKLANIYNGVGPSGKTPSGPNIWRVVFHRKSSSCRVFFPRPSHFDTIEKPSEARGVDKIPEKLSLTSNFAQAGVCTNYPTILYAYSINTLYISPLTPTPETSQANRFRDL